VVRVSRDQTAQGKVAKQSRDAGVARRNELSMHRCKCLDQDARTSATEIVQYATGLDRLGVESRLFCNAGAHEGLAAGTWLAIDLEFGIEERTLFDTEKEESISPMFAVVCERHLCFCIMFE
jgi:hypothetical protein